MSKIQHPLYKRPKNADRQACVKQLKEQVDTLVKWKLKAVIQLEHFRSACRIYQFYDEGQLNDLLNN